MIERLLQCYYGRVQNLMSATGVFNTALVSVTKKNQSTANASPRPYKLPASETKLTESGPRLKDAITTS